eukprot:5714110-Prymnesium_polylepis.2
MISSYRGDIGGSGGGIGLRPGGKLGGLGNGGVSGVGVVGIGGGGLTGVGGLRGGRLVGGFIAGAGVSGASALFRTKKMPFAALWGTRTEQPRRLRQRLSLSTSRASSAQPLDMQSRTGTSQ